jgi:WD40 repeat protein
MQEICNASGFSWRAPYLLALVHLERRDASQAETVLAEACQTPDVQAQVWIALGNALTGSGKLSQAIEAYRQALALKGDTREVMTRAAIALYMGGEKRKAEQLLKEPIGSDIEAQICLAGGRQKRFPGHTTPIRAVTLSRDGHFGASVGQSPDASLRLWDFVKGECLLDTSRVGVSCTCVAMSACGRFLLSGGADRRLRLWDIASAECIWTSETQPTDISFVAFYEAEDKALSVSQTDGILRVWNTLSGRLIGSQRLAEDITAFSAAEDVQKAIWTNGRSWFVWDLATGEYNRFPMAAQPISAIALSRDGQYALIALEEARSIQCWDIGKAALLAEMHGHTGSILSLDIGPEAKTCVSSDAGNTLRLWDLRTGQCILTLNVFAGHAAPIRLDGAGQHCLWGGWDKTLRLWHLGTPWPPAPLLPAEIVSSEVAIHRQSVAEGLIESAKALLDKDRWHEAAAEIHKARTIAGRERDPEVMRLWNLAGQGGRRRALHNGWAFRTFRADEPVTAVAFASDSRFVLSGDAGGALVQWDVETGEKARELRGHSSAINAIDACDTRPVVLTGAGVARGSDTTARLWDLETGKQVSLLQCIQGPNDVALSLDGSMALIGTGEVLREAPLRLYDLESARAVRDFEEHTEAVTAVDIHPGGCLAVSGFEDGAVALWDLCSGKSLKVYSEHNEMVTAVAFRPDGEVFLSSCMDGELRLWPLKNTAQPKLLKCSSPVTAAVFSPDGQFILVGCQDQTVQLWHAETGQRLRVFEGHTRDVKSVAFSPDGRLAVSGSSDRSVIVWELDWQYEFPNPVDWHPAATPFLENFLTERCPPNEAGQRQGPPKWSEPDVQRLLRDLRHAGLGWIEPEGVRKRLAAMTPTWRPPVRSGK